MNSPTASDGSLYEIALGSEQPSLVLQVSPATLKSIVGSFTELLTEQKIPAIVWAKLPRGDVWQGEIERYSQSTGLPKAIYQFKNYRDDGADDSSMVSSAIVPDGISRYSSESSERLNSDNQDRIVSIQLAPESHLRREYFLLVWSTQFQALILAHRPRSAHLFRTPATLHDAGSGGVESAQAPDDNQEKRQHLLALCSFDPGLILRVLGGIERAITVSYQSQTDEAQTTLMTPAISDLTGQASEWRQLVAEMPVAPQIC